VAARQTRVVVTRAANLVFNMKDIPPPDQPNRAFNMPLRYRLLTTGQGRQDAEVLVTLPILVHEGPAASQYWIGQGWTNFDRTTYSAAGHNPSEPPGERLVAGADAGPDVLRRWSKTINDWWGKAAVIHHPTGGREWYYGLKFEFSFTNDVSEACKEVCCVRTTGAALGTNPRGTIDAVRWGANDSGPGGPICHEVGHFLGCPDEYYTIEYDGKRKNWGNGYQPNAGVMNNPDDNPLARHYRKMGQELANQFHFNANEASIILDVTLGLNNPQQRRHRLSGHIWDGEPGVTAVS